MENKNILFIITGSIACYKACEVVAKLRQKNKVQVVMTKSAQEFVGTATLEALTSNPVLTDTFEKGKALDHIHEVRKADVIIIAPATANFINKISQGIGDDLASTMLLAHDFKKPLFLAPAMNTQMYNHPATKKSLEVLVSWGVKIIKPAAGILACGEVGEGKLASTEEILKSLKVSTKKLKVLITSGGTQEPIDDVRVLTNKSTGRTGAKIAEHFTNQGAEVTYLGAKMGFKPQSNCEIIDFSSFKDLQEKLKNLLKNHYDVIIHSAAVSDFSVKPVKGKLSSDNTPKLEFTKNPKLVDSLKKWSKNKKIKVVAFKLTSRASKEQRLEAVQKLQKHSKAELVVFNDLSEISKDAHPCIIYSSNNPEQPLKSKEELSVALWKILTS